MGTELIIQTLMTSVPFVSKETKCEAGGPNCPQ